MFFPLFSVIFYEVKPNRAQPKKNGKEIPHIILLIREEESMSEPP